MEQTRHDETVVPESHDDIFSEERTSPKDFSFDTNTSRVFDDMVSRSVPGYHEIQRMTGEIAADFATEGTKLVDLGCATGTTMLHLDRVVDPGVSFLGIDNSGEMLAKAREKLDAASLRHSFDLQLADLHDPLELQNVSVAVMLLTLQFVRPLYRNRVIRGIASGINEGGCLILVEKVTVTDSLVNRLFIKYYYDLKRRNGYSDMEIAQKREALENVLIPYRTDENRELLLSEGFRVCEEFYRWYNFVGMVAVR